MTAVKKGDPGSGATQRLIVAITGATGSIYGIRLLEILRDVGGWESHLILSEAGALNAWQDHGLARKDVNKLADVVHNGKHAAASVPGDAQ